MMWVRFPSVAVNAYIVSTYNYRKTGVVSKISTVTTSVTRSGQLVRRIYDTKPETFHHLSTAARQSYQLLLPNQLFRWIVKYRATTGQTSKAAAERYVYEYIEKNGIGTPGGRLNFGVWAKDFWSETGRYVKIRRAHGHFRSSANAYNIRRIARNHLFPEFESQYLDEIPPGRIENYLLDLYESGKLLEDGSRKPLPARTINTIRQCMKAIFSEAIRLQYIKFNPDVLQSVWNGETRFFLFTVSGAITGMRSGEIRALSPRHIQEEYIEINHGWDDRNHERTPTPKWGHRRIATIPSVVAESLNRWIVKKKISEDGYLFPATTRKGPIAGWAMGDRFHKTLERIGIDEQERR